MKTRFLALPLAVAAFIAPVAAPAVLPQGARAPQFVTQGALAGKAFTFNLEKALRKGPVVLYFYPKDDTPGCTREAGDFTALAEAFGSVNA